MLALLLGGLLFNAQIPWTPSHGNHHYLCAQQCELGSCARWCSTQQRCQATCTSQGQAACYCYL